MISVAIQCDRCNKEYDDIFDTILSFDYAETGRGKPGKYHLCMSCRKEMIKWLEKK